MSVRWQHCIDHGDINIQKPGDSPDCLLGEVLQLTDSQLSETKLSLTLRCYLVVVCSHIISHVILYFQENSV